jgi:hypothetical protein
MVNKWYWFQQEEMINKVHVKEINLQKFDNNYHNQKNSSDNFLIYIISIILIFLNFNKDDNY